MKNVIIKVLDGIWYTFSICLILWIVLSWFDVIADNHTMNPQHSQYNMFVLMTKDIQ